MKTLSRTEVFKAQTNNVFAIIDDLGVTGTHMTNSSAMMMGSRLHLNYLTPHHTGINSSYRWTGEMMGSEMDFTVKVTKWVEGKEKIWETIGETKLIIYSWYRMILKIDPTGQGSKVELSISYERPRRFFNKILSFLFADLYCKWCLKKMLKDAKGILNS